MTTPLQMIEMYLLLLSVVIGVFFANESKDEYYRFKEIEKKTAYEKDQKEIEELGENWEQHFKEKR